jgi:hypothetical protein
MDEVIIEEIPVNTNHMRGLKEHSQAQKCGQASRIDLSLGNGCPNKLLNALYSSNVFLRQMSIDDSRLVLVEDLDDSLLPHHALLIFIFNGRDNKILYITHARDIVNIRIEGLDLLVSLYHLVDVLRLHRVRYHLSWIYFFVIDA